VLSINYANAGFFDSIVSSIKESIVGVEQSINETGSDAGDGNNAGSEKKGDKGKLIIYENKISDIKDEMSPEERLQSLRMNYVSDYPDIKPVEYIGPTALQAKSEMSKYTSFFLDAYLTDLTAYYADAKTNQNKLISDGNYSYLFSYADNSNLLSSMQVDLKNIDNIKSLIKDKAGLMEPVFYFDDFKLKVDIDATKKLHTKLSKVLLLKPLDSTFKLGDVLIERILKETQRRSVLSEDQVYTLVHGKSKPATIGTLVSLIKEKNSAETEYRSIYNVRLNEIFNSPVFDGVSYMVVLNKDNMFVDMYPNFSNQKTYTEKYIREKSPMVAQTSGKLEVFRAYLNYKQSIYATLETLAAGLNYANTSIQILSIDRMKTLENTGQKLIPDFKITTTNIKKVDDYLLMNYALSLSKNVENEENDCSSGMTTIDLQCWKSMLDNYEKLWGHRVDSIYQKLLAKEREESIKQYDLAIAHFMKAKDALKITGAISSRRLK